MVQSQRTESEDKLGWWPQRSDTNFLFPQPLSTRLQTQTIWHIQMWSKRVRAPMQDVFLPNQSHTVSHITDSIHNHIYSMYVFFWVSHLLWLSGAQLRVVSLTTQFRDVWPSTKAHVRCWMLMGMSTQHARIRKHDNIKRIVSAFAQEAGLVTRCEPDTHSLLGEFSKSDCRRIFPKQGSKAYKTT